MKHNTYGVYLGPKFLGYVVAYTKYHAYNMAKKTYGDYEFEIEFLWGGLTEQKTLV
jgi:hypothetical protein